MKMECQILIDNSNLLWFNSYSSYLPEVIIEQKGDFLLSEQTLGIMDSRKWMGNRTYVLQAHYPLNMWNKSKYVKSRSRCWNIAT